MPNYDFTILSAIEFEHLCRDLLQAKFDKFFESFTSGRDDGIDLRYSRDPNKKTIVQCKRYTDFNSLVRNLRSESQKISKLAPKQYILCTSIGLTPRRKEKIRSVLGSYVKYYDNILGKDELNNLLGLFPTIERNHYKLWLSSTNVLNQIIHSRLYNQSRFELAKIEQNISIYVMNPSFQEALDLIKQYNFVIVSGNPGVGKTTLGRMLVYHLLAKGYEEFVYVLNNIAEADESYEDGKKQVFLYDDFLGTNFLETKLVKNEDKNIVRFIEKVNRSKNKILICTTREYILNQAKMTYEVFERTNIDIFKCIIDLSKYSKRIRAEILYNHLFFSALPSHYIENVLLNHRYFNIIKHKNYNPRIIELLTLHKKQWQEIAPEKFYDSIIACLNNPLTIWQHAFERQISTTSQYLLLILLTMGTPAFYDDLQSATRRLTNANSKGNDIKQSFYKFDISLKELENTFIILSKDGDDNTVVEFQNPSIRDFLSSYLVQHYDMFTNILKNTIFYSQFFHMADLIENNKEKVNIAIVDKIVNKLLSEFDNSRSSSLIKITREYRHDFYWSKFYDYEMNHLKAIALRFYDKHPQVRHFLKKKLSNISLSSLSSNELNDYFDILQIMEDDIHIDKRNLITHYAKKMTNVDDVLTLGKIKSIYPDEFNMYSRESPTLNKNIIEIIDEEYLDRSTDDSEYLLYQLQEIEQQFQINLENFKSNLQEEIDEQQSDEDNVDINSQTYNNTSQDESDDHYIMNMFGTLKEKNIARNNSLARNGQL